MNLNLSIVVIAAVLLSACSTVKKSTEDTVAHVEKNSKSSIPLERMDAQFLYLASQQALGRGQPVLAARFLQTLVSKKPEDIEPRFELVELYLAAGQQQQAQEAKRLMQLLDQKAVDALDEDSLERYQILYARALVASGEGLQAEELLQSLLQKHPENYQIRSLLVKMNVLSGNAKNAHQLLDGGMGMKDDLRLQQTKVQLYVQQKQFKKADQLLDQMQKKYPENETVVLDRARLANQQGDAVKAEILLKVFVKKHPEKAVQSYSTLAGLYVRQNRLDEAILLYQKMLPLTAGSVDVYTSLGRIFYQQQSYLEAVKMFESALERLKPQTESDELSEEQSVATFYLAASLEASHQWQKAVPYYQSLIPQHEFYLEAQLRLVSIDMTRQRFADAEVRLQPLLVSFESHIHVYEVLSSLRLQQKKYELLLKETEESLDLGFSQVILFNRAIAFETLKNFTELDATLASILQQEPDHAEALNFYGYSLADRGERLDEALVMVSKALKIKPDDGYYLDSLAWVYFKQKQYVKAIQYQSRAVELVPSDPIMQEHLGDIYWAASDFDKARVHWKKAVALDHESPDAIKEKIKRGLQ